MSSQHLIKQPHPNGKRKMFRIADKMRRVGERERDRATRNRRQAEQVSYPVTLGKTYIRPTFTITEADL